MVVLLIRNFLIVPRYNDLADFVVVPCYTELCTAEHDILVRVVPDRSLLKSSLLNLKQFVYAIMIRSHDIISAIAGISLKSELLDFFQINFCRDNECLLKNSDILFGSEYKQEI